MNYLCLNYLFKTNSICWRRFSYSIAKTQIVLIHNFCCFDTRSGSDHIFLHLTRSSYHLTVIDIIRSTQCVSHITCFDMICFLDWKPNFQVNDLSNAKILDDIFSIFSNEHLNIINFHLKVILIAHIESHRPVCSFIIKLVCLLFFYRLENVT